MPAQNTVSLARRFLQHPFYRYRVYLASYAHHRALLAMRTATHEGASALRIVDFSGDVAVLPHCGGALRARMREDNVEYADVWQSGLPEGTLDPAGFEHLDPQGPVVVPNYYEPFLAKNGRIVCAVK